MKKPKVHKGMFYWPTRADAERHALANGWPTHRLVEYDRGWAIQLYSSGPYVGPATVHADIRPEPPPLTLLGVPLRS